jgi:hypothetical protein
MFFSFRSAEGAPPLKARQVDQALHRYRNRPEPNDERDGGRRGTAREGCRRLRWPGRFGLPRDIRARDSSGTAPGGSTAKLEPPPAASSSVNCLPRVLQKT